MTLENWATPKTSDQHGGAKDDGVARGQCLRPQALICSTGESPASQRPALASAKARQTTDGSGLTQLGLFEKSDPAGFCSRTFLASLDSILTGLTGYSVSWKERAISAFRSC